MVAGGIPSKTLRILRPYFESGVEESGEVGMHCPLHEDLNRSSSLNVESDLWYCNVCSIGMSAEELVGKMRDDPTAVFPPPSSGSRGGSSRSRSGKSDILPDEGTIAGWHSYLMSESGLLKKFQRRRGLSIDTLARFQIGFDVGTRAFTIPVRDRDGNVINIRRYQLDPSDGRRKIWSVRGFGQPALYPIEILDDDPKEVVVCEGEWDSLLAIQNGLSALTRTGGADTWRSSWNNLFLNKDVFICHDADTIGQKANGDLVRELRGFAYETTIVKLPYDIVDSHGKDLTDFFFEDQFTYDDFIDLVNESRPVAKEVGTSTVLDSFSAEMAGEMVSLRVTITGKRYPTFLIPKVLRLRCTQSAGKKCGFCPMSEEHDGEWEVHVDPKDPIILKMISSPDSKVVDAFREKFDIQRCTLLTMDRHEEMAVEELYVRPAIDQMSFDPSSGDFTTRKILSVGRHDSQPNNTVLAVGAVHPNPKTQHNEFLAWNVEKTETGIDTFRLTDTGVEMMKLFRTSNPLAKIRDIADDLSNNVTHIYGRPHMHAVMDLVWHSVISFSFMGDVIPKGWIEALVIGDTRTGKSEAASKIISHYSAGEMISCESASFAGVVGGLQQMGDKEWEVTWGALPLNDRRLVVLDEVSGLTTDQIGQMSSIRSSGIAELTKIRQERTLARTRILWLSNPRNGGRMAQFPHGVFAIRPLIGNMEDVARFDLAMAVAAEDVDSKYINRFRVVGKRHIYPADPSRQLIQWVWSRKPENVAWGEWAEKLVLECAIDMGKNYIEDPPLIQSANVRYKIARLAVAMAARTFSTTPEYDNVLVTTDHVEAAVEFLGAIYGMESFGYTEYSQERIEDARDAVRRWGESKAWLTETPQIIRFLRTSESGIFKSNDLQDFMNLDRYAANKIINTLFGFRLVSRKGAYIEITPMLQQMIREIQKG